MSLLLDSAAVSLYAYICTHVMYMVVCYASLLAHVEDNMYARVVVQFMFCAGPCECGEEE